MVDPQTDGRVEKRDYFYSTDYFHFLTKNEYVTYLIFRYHTRDNILVVHLLVVEDGSASSSSRRL